MRSLLLGVLLAIGLLGPAHAAITFDFSWSGKNGNDEFSATGLMTIGKSAGDVFTLSDITFTNITVNHIGVRSFTFTSWTSAGGRIAADGLSASFSLTDSPSYFNSTNGDRFGCFSAVCTRQLAAGFGGSTFFFLYDTPDAALASMKLTAVPLPAALPMAAVAFGGLAALSRRRRGTAGAGRA